MRTGNHRVLPHLGSLLVILCLLAAPLCPTRCALSSCAKPNTPEQSKTGCHHLPNHPRGSSAITGAIAPTCIPVDSLLTTLPARQFRLLSSVSFSQGPSATLSSPSNPETLSMIAFCISDKSSSPGNAAFPLANSPLRL